MVLHFRSEGQIVEPSGGLTVPLTIVEASVLRWTWHVIDGTQLDFTLQHRAEASETPRTLWSVSKACSQSNQQEIDINEHGLLDFVWEMSTWQSLLMMASNSPIKLQYDIVLMTKREIRLREEREERMAEKQAREASASQRANRIRQLCDLERQCTLQVASMHDECNAYNAALASLREQYKAVEVAIAERVAEAEAASNLAQDYASERECLEDDAQLELLAENGGELVMGGAALDALNAPRARVIKAVKEVDLCCNRLTALPEALVPMGHALKRLSVSRNMLQTLPASWGAAQIKKLFCNGNEMVMLPRLPGGVVVADFSCNRIEGEVHLSSPQTLQALRVNDNRISSLCLELPNLTFLNASFNCLASLPIGLGSNISKLQLAHNQLQLLTSELLNCSRVIEMDLSENKLSELPSALDALGALRRLDMHGNKLVSIPSSLYTLSSLLELNVSSNLIIELPTPPPSTICTLVDLFAARNLLSAIPTFVLDALPRLHRLDVTANRLQELDLAPLQQLRALMAASNQMNELPAHLNSCSQLQTLFLNGNPMSSASLYHELPHLVELEPTSILPSGILQERLRPTRRSENGEIDGRTFEAGVAQACGRRKSMEDWVALQTCSVEVDVPACLLCIFDGHGGDEAAEMLANEMPAAIPRSAATIVAGAMPSTEITSEQGLPTIIEERASFQRVEARVQAALRLAFQTVGSSFCQQPDRFGYVGSTATVAVLHATRDRTSEGDAVHADLFLTVANVGDSAALLLMDVTSPKASCRWLTTLHRPSEREEEERIWASGGSVSEDGELNGMLGVSRAFGDVALPPPHCYEPAITTARLAGDNSFVLIVASDGLWDVLTDSEAMTIIAATEGDAVAVAAALRDEALVRGSSDNISVGVILV
eukprot:CAMPEP_0119321880 /NCGR_PEP_ID=MMETSP1333-20130426/56690_1 /TAXON_ID=418940 /ORGANISM="Scyphosphaera apsteinii, Strain RCC1455" /LENGTH=889 /DNA_ID=CAMNT_0007328963 /DNA_START=23 /DNA_END=2692 /DNA_ORIENTATION=+